MNERADEVMSSTTWLRRLITAVLLVGLVLLGWKVMDPFIVPLLWAAILAFVTWPAYEWLLVRVGDRRILASLIMTLIVSLAVIVPLAWLGAVLRIEVVHAYHKTQELLAGGVQLPPPLLRIPWLGDRLRELTQSAMQDPHVLGAELRNIADHSFENIAHVLGGVSRNVVKLVLAVISLFFVYRGGQRFARQLAGALEQVLGPRVHNYLAAIGQTVKAVVYGLVLAAGVQGVLVGLGYWIAGAGAPVFLAALTTVCGLIPFAVPAILIGVVGWLLIMGHTVAAIGLGIWGGLVVGWTDHMVRPFLISREAEIPFLLVMFGVLGGLAAFGLVGLFIGPVILAVLLAIWREWLHESGQPQSVAPIPQPPRNIR
jgi:predicted PurR-regulated permease PerM